MVDIKNIGAPQVISRGFVPLAVEAGIIEVIQSLVVLATDKRSLLIDLKTQVFVYNPKLADALNTETLDALLRYMSTLPDSPIVTADELPELLDEDGPVQVSAGRDGSVPTQINITYSAPPEGYTAEIYLDGVFVKHSADVGKDGFANGVISDVETKEGEVDYQIRVLYRSDKGAQTRFGELETVK